MRSDGKDRRVLLVDDDARLLRVLTAVLEHRLPDVVFESCPSPRDALALVEARMFHVVVTDLFMGGTSGLHLLERAQATRLPPVVIVLTGAIDREVSVRALQRGARHVLQKPVDPDDLAACIRGAIQVRRLREKDEA